MPQPEQTSCSDDERKALLSALNSHGYALPLAAYRIANEAFQARESQWLFRALELPIKTRDRDSRIDLLLSDQQNKVHLTIECKRVNPKFGRWVFAKAPPGRRNREQEFYFIDGLWAKSPDDPLGVSGYVGSVLPDCFHIAFSAKHGSAESDGHSRNQIEEAISQSVTGANGLLEHWCNGIGHRAKRDGTKFVMPVVLTTANLFGCDADLAECPIDTATISGDAFKYRTLPWAFVQYPVGYGIKTEKRVPLISSDIGFLYDADMLRTVAVVQSASWRKFLGWFSGDRLGGLTHCSYALNSFQSE